MKSSIIYLIVISFLFHGGYANSKIDLKDSAPFVNSNHKIRSDLKFVKSKLEIVKDSTITVLESKNYKDIPITKINEFKVSKILTLTNLGLEWGVDLIVIGFNLQW
jgi:hypothetical protein